jgi:hypothetical protein
VSALGDEDVRRLDVAMNDSFGMSGVERVGNLNRQIEQNIGLDGFSGDAMLQRHAVQKLHHKLPFFIGVVSQSPPEMRIYSAELLPLLFSEKGPPKRLSLVPVSESEFDPDLYCDGVDGAFRLRCPLVVTLSIIDDRPTLEAKVAVLLSICTRTLSNIAARVSEEHIYNDGRGHYRIIAGPGSNRFFRDNFLKRFGEVLYNLLWIFDSRPGSFSIAEFQVFESLLRGLETVYGGPLPNYVSAPYGALKAKLKTSGM